MLSINPVKSADHAKQYFMSGDNYYIGDGEGRSVWWGKGAESLGLSGAVKEVVFENLLKGNLPDGQMLGKVVDGKVAHRPGFDLTFSIPKSASIVALRSDDKSIYESIIQSTFKAVEKTLGLIEHSCAQARVTREGNTYYVNTKNLVAALHLHELTREDEAGIHVHAVVMNMTERNDGKWRSLASKSGYYGKNATTEINGFFERVGNQKKQLGAIFRAELAYDLKQKGFPIVVTNQKQGFFEIDGISQDLIDAHSTRSLQKKAYMDEHGFAGGNASAIATKITRRSKSKKSQLVINQEWKDKEKARGVDANQEVLDVIQVVKNGEKDTPVSQPSLTQARSAVEYAIDLLSETQIKIKLIQLINSSVKNSLGQHLNVESIVKVIDELRISGVLVPIEQQSGEMIYTTKALLKCEQEIILATAATILDKNKILPSKIASFLEKEDTLTKEQKEAIHTIFTSDNRITALEGKSNTGKSSLIKPMVELAKENGYESIILTPSKAGSLALKNEIQKAPNIIQQFFKNLLDRTQYSSVSGFIHEQMRHIEAGTQGKSKRILFVDNAQLLSLKQMRDLAFVTENTNARLVPLFDKRATLSWQSGNPLQQMLENGMKTATLENVIKTTRHKNIQDAVKDTLEGNINEAFKKIENRILEIEDKELRNNTIASMYVRSTYHEQKHTQVIMVTRAQCEESNLAIHDELKREKQISSIGSYVPLLIPKSMKTAEYRLAQNYQPGQWVRFNEKYSSLNVERGDYLKIININKKSNIVTLENKDKKTVPWNPLKLAGSAIKVEVFEEKTREISKGEVVIWKRNNRNHVISSGEKLKVLSTASNKLVLERENRKKISIDLRNNENRHFDYGYSTTPNGAISKKAETVIAYQNAHSRQSHQRLFYKVLSQANKEAWIVTESKNELLNNIRQNTGDKITVIDTLMKEDKHLITVANSQQEHVKILEKAVSQVITRLIASEIPADKTLEMVSKEAVNYALTHLAEREAAFAHRDVMDVALKHVLGEANSDHIQKAVIQAEKEGILVKGVYSSDGTRWTTRDAIEMEREIITLAKADQGKLPALIEGNKVDHYLIATPMKKDHEIAIKEWMKTPDRIVIVQGNAGTGKTTMLERAEPLFKSEPMLNGEGYELLCLAPTHNVVDELRSRGLKAQTLDSFIGEQNLARTSGAIKKFNDKLIIAVDENSMVSNRRERDFLAIIHEIEARAALIGDQRQYSSIESGKPHTLLQSIGIKTINLTDIVRQKNPILIKGVDEIYQNDFQKAFMTLKDHIVEIGQDNVGVKKGLDNSALRLEKIGQDFLSLTPLERATTGVTTLGNAQRIYLNSVIRDGLKQQGELHGNSINTVVLVSSDMTKVQHTKITNFNTDDIIRFGFNDHNLNVKKGDYLSVVTIHKKENLITLRKQDGEQVIWRPKQLDKETYSGIEVYRVETREIMPGDLIRWTRSDKTIGLVNPNMARIESIDKGNVVLHQVKMTETGIIRDGKSFNIQMNNPKYQHWDYAHVMTSYGAQGRGFKNVMSNMESYSRNLTNQAAFLIVVTRSIDNLTIYTDNKQALLEKIMRTPGTKTSALETIGEVNLKRESKRKNEHQNIEKTIQKKRIKKEIHHDNKNKTATYFDANRIISDLHLRAESIVRQLLGEPKSRSGTNYQYSYSEHFGGEDGKREGGSLSIAISGEKQGLWTCFKTGEKGNLIGLIQKKFNMDFKQSLEYSAQLLGLSTTQILPQHNDSLVIKVSEPIDKSDPKNWSKNEKYMVTIARKLARESQPIQGTLGEKYLREHRGVGLENFPSDIRFHPAVSSGKDQPVYPALLAIGRNEKGQVQRVQVIYLDEKTANKADLNVKKRSYAPAPGSSVNLSRNIKNKHVTYLAEGVETGLSIQQSVDNGNVEVVLGKSNFKHPSLKNMANDVVLCLDNDGTDPTKENDIHAAAIALGNKGKTVWIAKPNEIGKDYNDILKEQGRMAVKNSIELAIPYKEYANKSQVTFTTLKETLSAIKDRTLTVVHGKMIHHHINNQQNTQINNTNKNNTIDPSMAQPISNKFIENFALSHANKSSEIISKYHDVSKLDTPKIHSQEVTKVVNKIKDNEREL
jgi:conjugative transfer relaxase protein TraI